MNETIGTKDVLIEQKGEALSKAEHVIRRMQAEVSNAKRVLEGNERELKVLKEQYRNLQVSYHN